MIVIQHRSTIVTKADQIYRIKCSYDTSSSTVSFGMGPVRDKNIFNATAAPAAPTPRIFILDPATKNEVQTVHIGDKLLFKIRIPESTPYGIFARNCVATAKDSGAAFSLIDEDGCPNDPEIFSRFTADDNLLVSEYEAFRFTESYGVIFQCNVKYCLGPCPPVSSAINYFFFSKILH